MTPGAFFNGKNSPTAQVHFITQPRLEFKEIILSDKTEPLSRLEGYGKGGADPVSAFSQDGAAVFGDDALCHSQP